MTDQQRRLGTPSTSGAEAAPASAGEQLAVELRRLYEAAGAPEHAVLARQAAAQRPPVKLPGSTFNDWLNGKTVPSASAAFDFVVTFLLARPDVRTHPGYQQRPLPWWQTLRAQAQAERRAARSRPRRSPTLTESPHSASSTETSTSASISSTARSAITAAPVYLPSQAGEFFVGRQGELARLDAAFTTSFDAAAAREGPVAAVVHQRSGPGRRVGAVHGLGGIGKSTLAAHWAATRRGEGETVWWIVADSPTAVREGLAGLGTALLGAEAAGKPLKALAEHAIGWLTRHHDWLLVLDNVHRPVDIEPVLARLAGAAGGRVLITSRLSTGWHRITGQVIALDVLEPEQAVELLTRTVTAERPGADLEGADELCAELGYLPLAIEQAAGYLAVNACSPRAYLQRLATYPAALYSHPRPGHDDNLDQTVARVWRSTLDHLTTAIPLAGTVLRVLAWWAPGEIPRALLDGLGEHLAGEDAGMAVQEAVAQLAAYNMITLSDDGQRIGVHRLVQAIARTPAPPGADHTIDPHRRANDITAACHLATTLLNQNRPADPFDPAGWPAWRTLLPHIEALADHTRPDQDTSTLSRLLDRTAAFLQDQGALTRAITYLERALAANQRLQGDDHPSTLTSRHNLALAYREVGDTGRAINLLERALADSERVRGADHSFTLTSRHNLAFAYREVGQVQRAISLYTQTLADSERVLGADHPSTLTSRHNLAVAYREVGQVQRAIDLHMQTLADRERILGADHPDTLISRNSLAVAYREAGKLQRAIDLLEQTLADRERVLGTDHPDTLTSCHSLAVAYRGVGQVQRAIDLHMQTLADRERILGADHPDTLISRNSLAVAYREAGKLQRAIDLLEQTLADRERVLGTDHPDTLTSRHNLAVAYHEGGEVRQAVDLLKRALTSRERILGEDHPAACRTRACLVSALDERDNADPPPAS